MSEQQNSEQNSKRTNTVNKIIKHARDWASFGGENGFMGPIRITIYLARAIHELDIIDGCTCPQDGSNDLADGCPVHDVDGDYEEY